MEKPTNQIFSRQAHQTTTKHVILKHKLDILEQKEISLNKGIHTQKEQVENVKEDIKRKFQEIDKMKKQINENRKKQVQPSASFQAQSREGYYMSQSSKNWTPPCGTYKTQSDYIKPPRQQRIISPDFQKQLSRLPLNKENQVNEQRFENKKISSLLQKKVTVPKFKKYLDRDDLIYKSTLSTKQYDPKYEFIEKKLAQTVNFGKQTQRTDIMVKKTKVTTPEGQTFYDYQQKENNKAPNFNQYVQRFVDNQSPLPSFMRRIWSRGGIQLTSEKSLDLNYFANGKFGKVQSSFKNAQQNISTLKNMKKMEYEQKVLKKLEKFQKKNLTMLSF